MRPVLRALSGVVLLLFALAPSTSEGQPAPEESKPLTRFEFLQIRMAIPVRITVYAPDEATANRASRSAFSRFKELDRVMSDYDPDSELSRFVQQAGSGPRAISADLFTVLDASWNLAELTDGAFDATIGPMTRQWRRTRRRQELPSPDERRLAQSQVGWRHLLLSHENRTAELRRPGMSLDLGGIAKGFAADQALKAMAAEGVTIALVDAGGDVVAGKAPPGQPGWKIGIAPLEAPRDVPQRFLFLQNQSVATSGDAFQHVEIDGVRYSHIVDPKTGLGVTTPSSVTVLAPAGMQADGLASAVSVLGPVEGIRLVETLPEVETYVVTRDSQGNVMTHMSSGFGRLTSNAAE